MDLILRAKSQSSIKQMCKIPQVVKPGGLSNEVTVLLVVLIQWAAIEAYFNQKVLKAIARALLGAWPWKLQFLKRKETFSATARATRGKLGSDRPWYIAGRVLHSHLILQLSPEREVLFCTPSGASYLVLMVAYRL
jgi:hypothetical protein